MFFLHSCPQKKSKSVWGSSIYYRLKSGVCQIRSVSDQKNVVLAQSWGMSRIANDWVGSDFNFLVEMKGFQHETQKQVTHFLQRGQQQHR